MVEPCPYCQSPVELASSTKIYGGRDYGPIMRSRFSLYVFLEDISPKADGRYEDFQSWIHDAFKEWAEEEEIYGAILDIHFVKKAESWRLQF